MTNATLTYPGQINGAGVTDALFLKVFAGEVLTAFSEINIMKGLHVERTIKNGKSASFPVMWKANARYHVPGTPVLGSNNILHGERVISIDDLLLADVVIYNLDEAKNHYDVRSEYSFQLGEALARKYDQKTMRVATLAARATGAVTGAPGGTQLSHANMATNADTLVQTLFKAAQTFDEKDVPVTDRSAIVKPVQYYMLAQNTTVINKDWGGSGMYQDGTVFKVAGLTIKKSNNVPSGVVTAETGEKNTYNGDFTKTVAIAMQKQAIGTVKLMDLAVQKTGQDFNAMYQADMIIAKYAIGHGILRPECAIELAIV